MPGHRILKYDEGVERLTLESEVKSSEVKINKEH